MRFAPPTLSSELAALAQKPEINLESSVYVSAVEVVKLGVIEVDASGNATWRARNGVSIPAAGYDLHLCSDDGVPVQSANPTVTLNVTLVGAVTTTAVAAYAVPAWATDQQKFYPVNKAADFVPTGAGNSLLLVTAITGLSTSANLPANSTFSVWGSPGVAANTFALVGYKRNAEGAYKVPGSVEIPDGYDASAAVKKGRSDQANLTLDFAHISAMDGMTRYNGQRVAVWVRVVKDKAAHVENVVYCGYRPESSPKRGDGDGEVVESSTGSFEKVLLFTAG
jgi:hypothetical protein